jgi:hypothetical protein
VRGPEFLDISEVEAMDVGLGVEPCLEPCSGGAASWLTPCGAGLFECVLAAEASHRDHDAQ